MRTSSPVPVRTLLVAALLGIAACGDSPTAPPGIEPRITNATDNFAYQLSDLSDVTGVWDYTWQNTGTLAKVTHSTDAGASGSATLTIRDGAGTQVYSGALATSGETVTSPEGVAGAWTVTLTYSNYSNTQVNFAVIKQ